MASIRLVSLNVERRKHTDAVAGFLKEHRPDVVCFQELAASDVSRFATVLKCGSPLFVPLTREKEPFGEFVVHGTGIMSALPMTNSRISYYAGDPASLPDSDTSDPASFTAVNRLVMFADVEKDRAVYRIGTTHFTWSARGEAVAIQQRDMEALLGILEHAGEFVLAGDFNAPRGGEIFSELASRYKDNIPSHYKTSIDLTLHRAGNIDPEGLATKMVDGLFTTPGYVATNVELVSGLSDHCAINAKILKQQQSE